MAQKYISKVCIEPNKGIKNPNLKRTENVVRESNEVLLMFQTVFFIYSVPSRFPAVHSL